MHFLIEDDYLLEKYNTIWDKVSNDIRKEWDSEPVYSKYFTKIKIKSYGDEAADFHNKEMSQADFNHTCLAVITNDSALKRNENYHPEVFLNECKHS